MEMIHNFVDAITGKNHHQHQQNLGATRHKVEGMVVLMKKNVLDFNDFNATVLDGVHEMLGKHVTLQLVSSVTAEHPTGAAGTVLIYT